MKNLPSITVAGGLIVTTSVALANDWVNETMIKLDTMQFTFHEIGTKANETFSFDIELEDSNMPVVGFAVNFDYLNVGNDTSWASDLELQITTPSGNMFVVGQTIQDGGNPFGPEDDFWDFDGPNSQDSGPYFSDHFPWKDEPELQGGMWNFTFTETWDGEVSFSNVVVTLYKIPAPGALALLGVAGLLGGSRRRRR